ncbi:MAG: hypothetical protein K6E27_01490 [Eubacterium sp.]|nr:hypothetical protein [Eubacterium sp.]
MKKLIDVTEQYINMDAPGDGRILYESGYNHNRHDEEISMATWIHDNLGGEIILLSETGGTFGARRSDYEWKGRYWELKTIKSEKAVDSALRKAISQIYDKPGGVILDFGKNNVRLPQIESAIKSRIESSCRFKIDVMIIINGQLRKVLRFD